MATSRAILPRAFTHFIGFVLTKPLLQSVSPEEALKLIVSYFTRLPSRIFFREQRAMHNDRELATHSHFLENFEFSGLKRAPNPTPRQQTTQQLLR